MNVNVKLLNYLQKLGELDYNTVIVLNCTIETKIEVLNPALYIHKLFTMTLGQNNGVLQKVGMIYIQKIKSTQKKPKFK